MDEEKRKLEADIERLIVSALGISQLSRIRDDSDGFGRYLAVSRWLHTALKKLREPKAIISGTTP